MDVAPELMPTSEQEIARMGQMAQKEPRANVVWCLKSHLLLKNPPPVNRFISTFRNPRDALISYVRFTGYDIDAALGAARFWKQLYEHYRSMPSHMALSLDYEDITNEPSHAVRRIAAFLDLTVDTKTTAAIVDGFSREKVRELTTKLQASVATPDRPTMTIPKGDGTIRVCDRLTGFQTGHIASPDTGETPAWLNEQQQRAIDEVGSWW
jgi:hypothetical protein